MRRNVSLDEISDGRLYGVNDMVKADCHGCQGCHKCCTGMGNSVILDPFDVWRLCAGTGKSLQDLLAEGRVELNVVDGCILPNLRMSGEEEACGFLDAEGRCSIHAYRPGVCRLFPLGRYYENDDFRYFLQVGECAGTNRSKVKVGRWIDTPDQAANHDFVCSWHRLLKDVEEAVKGQEDGQLARQLNMALLTGFYLEQPVSGEDFYLVYGEREKRFRRQYGI